ncbi:MAG TPA: hypothetical protein PLJ95_02375 [Candidatus Hydrogenedentes bacterium]|nr:hypothetical protein [Candidatus Hydrogenedentota bacterium]
MGVPFVLIQDIRLSYQEAIQLIRIGHYDAARNLLKRINEAQPNVKNVLYPLAVCCEYLDLVDEGLDYCDQLISLFDHDKAKMIQARLLEVLPVPEEVQEIPKTEASVSPPPQKDSAETFAAPVGTVDTNKAPQGASDTLDESPPPFSDNTEVFETQAVAVSLPDAKAEEGNFIDTCRVPPDVEEKDIAAERESSELMYEEATAVLEEIMDEESARDNLSVHIPLWFVLLLAFLAAVFSAALIHYFILGTEGPVLLLNELFAKMMAAYRSLMQ